MNKALLKRISRHTDVLLVQWVKSLVTEEEAEKVTLENIHDLMPDDRHVYLRGQARVAPNSPKWIRKMLKKAVTTDPSLLIEDITLKDLECQTTSLPSTLKLEDYNVY
tara:strand:- start:717 stop:1040 length:324 start_codon:yes stop_codon:yes gene_type:complete